MLVERITESELLFMESFHTPRCLVESLFSDYDNLSEFDENKFGNLRLYQIPFLSHEPIIDEKVPGLSVKEQFELRKNVGDSYNFGARKFGKSLISEKLDIPISILHDDGWWCAFTSYDAIHIDSILDVIKEVVENHPIIKYWKKEAKKSPKWKIVCKNGWRLEGVNQNIFSKNPGHQWYGLHVKKVWMEESSLEPLKVEDKRQDSLSELGAVLRFSGMTNFVRYSPAGKVFYDYNNKNKLINLPQFVNPLFDEKDNADRIKHFSGKDSVGYKIYVLGEVEESGISEFDMERVKQCYNKKKEIKSFEINKKNFSRFKDVIVAEQPPNADRVFICSDIGESASSEIIILSEIGEKYNYLYNISLFNLKFDEQFAIFDWLIGQVKANVVGLDCGDGTGRAIYRQIEKKYGKENLVEYRGTFKLAVDFEKDEKGNIVIKKGQPQYTEEFMSEFSVRRLKTLLYEARISIPKDYKFDSQFNQVVSMQSGSRRIYKCIAENDHLFDAFRVFSIAQWMKKDFNQTKPMSQDWGIGV